MDLWVILLAACLVSGLVAAAQLLWIAANAILHGRGLGQEAEISIANLRRILRSVYRDTVRESLPDEFLDLLARLTRHGPQKAGTLVEVRLASN